MENCERYGLAYEPGCSVGELTAQLALRCKRVLATDISPSAVARATLRCEQHRNVTVRLASGPVEVPSAPVDLLMFSELGYYFTAAELGSFSRRLAATLVTGGEFVAVHWLGHSPDHRLHGNRVHEQLMASLPLTWISGQRLPGFRIDSWRQP